MGEQLQEKSGSCKKGGVHLRMVAVGEWLKMVLRAKLGKHTHVHAHAVTDIALNHFLKYFNSTQLSG